MKKILVSTVCFLVVLISCRQQEDVSLSQEDLVNIKLIQKNRNYRKINNITNIKTDTVYRIQTLDIAQKLMKNYIELKYYREEYVKNNKLNLSITKN